MAYLYIMHLKQVDPCMNNYYKPDTRSAYNAIFEAQKIAFGPFVFQATRALLKTGILKKLEEADKDGATVEQLSKDCAVTEYGVGVLLDMALSAKIVWMNPDTDHYHLDKVGHFLLNDQMTKVNFDFTADVNYLGLDKLLDSVIQGRPVGLKEFSETEDTIYPLLSQLPEEAKKSWFEFDHFYSDESFDRALKKVFEEVKPKVIMDIGANTGKWAIQCLKHDPNVKIVLVDLASQLNMARKNMEELGFLDRVEFIECDLLKDDIPERSDVDLVWLSQFLDCFSTEQIENILTKVKNSVRNDARVFILELFWDRQEHEAAAFVLNATSLYFTAIANGNSRIYSSRALKKCLQNTGFKVKEQIDHIAIGGHTLLSCTFD